ncbi:hypothetical protein D3C73_1511070 [compost metagenome]
METGSARNSEIFATRLRMDLTPLDLIFSGFTFSAETTFSISESSIRVPWLNMRPLVTNWAFPEIFRSPT